MSTNTETTLINFTIDGKPVTVPKGTTVYTAAKQNGIDIPIFCYQDRMPAFGACRVCLVEVEKMPKLQTSCTLQATDGMVVNTRTPNAKAGREEILEFLLINHPLDCPVCDKGGECPLQDQTMKYGPGISRFFEEKRKFTKPLPLGPVLMLDRERCIVCARCTRFGEEIAGDSALTMKDRGFKTEVGTPDGGTPDSKFIGNTIMICPVGALTSRVYRFRARPWDNKPTKTTCTLCPVGCSMILDERDGEIMRTRSCENKAVNDIWLCDKGWFGYEFTDHAGRLKHPLIRHADGQFREATWEEALTLVAQKLKDAKSGGKIAGFGGNPLTTEENYLFQQLMREGAGVNNVDHRIGMPIIPVEAEGVLPGMEMTIGETEDLSYAVLFGLDITEEFPVIWLRLKQAINKGAKVIFLGHYAPEVAQYFTQTAVHAPGQELEMLKQHLPKISELVNGGKKGAFFVGRQYLENGNRRDILAEILKVRLASPNLSLNIMEGTGNSQGARLAGMRPDMGPLGVKLDKPGSNFVQVLDKAAESGWDVMYIAGANPIMKAPTAKWQKAKEKLGFLVVQDMFLTETAKQADVILPTLSYVEKHGSFVNIEGRVQKIHPGKLIPESLLSDGEIFNLVAKKMNVDLFIQDDVKELLHMERLPYVWPEKIESKKNASAENTSSNALLASFATELFDNGVRMKHDYRLGQLAKAPKVRIHPEEAAKRKISNDSYVKLKANGNVIEAVVKVDKTVALGTIVIPIGFEQLKAYEFGTNLLNGIPVEIV